MSKYEKLVDNLLNILLAVAIITTLAVGIIYVIDILK